MSSSTTILPLEQAGDSAGGKAAGLAQLLRHGLPVPPGFVIVGAEPGRLPAAAVEAFRALGGPVAVRSSALGEDGEHASFAGQYESVLGVEGEEAFAAAVDQCLRSLHNARASSYAGTTQVEAKAMAVVVQRMVPARAAGVLFTLDPISGRKDRMAVDAVAGLGEQLVSGRATPDHVLLARDGRVVRRELAGEAPVLGDAELAQLAEGARRAEAGFGRPLDMEWAFDAEGRLSWLQARPITVTAGDLHEFDHAPGADHVYTTANIGEMMPGAVCPLTLSTTVYGIDQSTQMLWQAAGTHPTLVDELQMVGIFNGHLFIDMTSFAPFNKGTLGCSPEVACLTLVGHVVPEVVAAGERAGLWKRLVHGVNFFKYVLSATGHLRRHEEAMTRFALPPAATPREAFEAIDRGLPFLVETYRVHLQVSSRTAVMTGVLEGMVGKKAKSDAEREALTASLLAGAGTVSAQLIHELDDVLEIVARHPQAKSRFAEAGPAEALRWLMGPDSGEAGGAFRNYLSRWGHRAYRELDLREKGWADDPLPLAVSLRASLLGRQRKAPGSKAEAAAKAAPAPELDRGLRWAAEKARRGVVQREYSKNLLVDMTNRFKRAYRRLADLLVDEGVFASQDDVFFFTHQELGRIARGEDRALPAKAGPRRAALERQQAFQYPVVSIGIPEPLADETPANVIAGELRGKPVSAGVAMGRARVAHALEDGAALQPGEILIAPFADVGWTPYFNLIAGLATEVGSAFCHGAVVAREYGLPTIVNVRAATRRVKTGDYVLLDADQGLLRKMTDEEYAAAQKPKPDAESVAPAVSPAA